MTSIFRPKLKVLLLNLHPKAISKHGAQTSKINSRFAHKVPVSVSIFQKCRSTFGLFRKVNRSTLWFQQQILLVWRACQSLKISGKKTPPGCHKLAQRVSVLSFYMSHLSSLLDPVKAFGHILGGDFCFGFWIHQMLMLFMVHLVNLEQSWVRHHAFVEQNLQHAIFPTFCASKNWHSISIWPYGRPC